MPDISSNTHHPSLYFAVKNSQFYCISQVFVAATETTASHRYHSENITLFYVSFYTIAQRVLYSDTAGTVYIGTP